jgi:hypothetical protein
MAVASLASEVWCLHFRSCWLRSGRIGLERSGWDRWGPGQLMVVVVVIVVVYSLIACNLRVMAIVQINTIMKSKNKNYVSTFLGYIPLQIICA